MGIYLEKILVPIIIIIHFHLQETKIRVKVKYLVQILGNQIFCKVIIVRYQYLVLVGLVNKAILIIMLILLTLLTTYEYHIIK